MFDTDTLEKLSYDEVRAFVPAITSGEKQLAIYLSGQLWNNGLGYDGPMPQPGPSFNADMLVLRRSFVPVPKLQEVLRRHVRGVVGKEPSFEIVADENDLPAEAPDGEAPVVDAEVEAVNNAQTQWWDEADVMDGGGCLTLIQLFTAHLRAYGRACLRFDVPPGYVVSGVDRETGEETQGIEAGDFGEAMNLIFAEVPTHGSAAVHIDPVTRQRVAVYLYEEDDSSMNVATCAANKVKCAQVSTLDKDKKTVVRVLRENGQHDEPRRIDCGGQLLVLEAKLPPLLATVFFSESMRMLQERLNGVSTMIKINANVAGFPERVGIDLEKPTVKVPDSASEGGTKEEAVPLATGPRTSPFLASMTDEDPASGAITVRSGTMLFRTPVSSEPLRDDAKFFEELIYAATHQRHLSQSISAAASGEALIQWLADYADSLLETRPFVEKVLRAFLKGTACLAAFLAADDAKLTLCRDSRWRVDCQLNAGPLSSDMRRVLMEEYKAGGLSRETWLVLKGTEDVDAEIAKIDEDENRNLFPAFPGGESTPTNEPQNDDPTEDEDEVTE